MAQPFTLPSADTPFIDQSTGLVTQAWYIFLVNLFQTGSDGSVGGPNDVLHGAPTGYAPVDLTTDVSGRLPLTNFQDALVARLLIAQGVGNDPAYRAISGDATINSQGVITVSTVSGAALGPYATATLGQLPGTTTQGAAAAGNIGQFESSTVTSGSAVSLTTNSAANVTAVSLTAGDWNVWGNVVFVGGAGTLVTQVQAWMSVTSATAPTAPNSGALTLLNVSFPAAGTQALPAGVQRVTLSQTTSVYLGAYSLFGVNTQSAHGFIGARRMR